MRESANWSSAAALWSIRAPWQAGGLGHAASERCIHTSRWVMATQHPQGRTALALVVQVTNLEVNEEAQTRRGTTVSTLYNWGSNRGCKLRRSRRSTSRSVVTVFQIWEYSKPMRSPPQHAQTTREPRNWLRKLVAIIWKTVVWVVSVSALPPKADMLLGGIDVC